MIVVLYTLSWALKVSADYRLNIHGIVVKMIYIYTVCVVDFNLIDEFVVIVDFCL